MVNLKAYRKRAGMTQQELAERVGVTPSAISHWETGSVTNIGMDNLRAIADALGVSTADILGTVSSKQDDIREKLVSIVRTLTEEQCEAVLTLLQR